MKYLQVATLLLVTAATGGIAGAQTSPQDHQASTPMHHPMAPGPMTGAAGHAGMPAMMTHEPVMQADTPSEPGQAAFGAIQEIVRSLQADPGTDWSKVDIDALRQHLIDMDEVTMRATAHKEPIENGVRIEVTGTGRTLEAIQHMVPDHAREIDGMSGWNVRTEPLPSGVVLIVTAGDAAEAQKLRALGFIGIMAMGGHHQAHHLAMARGEHIHTH